MSEISGSRKRVRRSSDERRRERRWHHLLRVCCWSNELKISLHEICHAHFACAQKKLDTLMKLLRPCRVENIIHSSYSQFTRFHFSLLNEAQHSNLRCCRSVVQSYRITNGGNSRERGERTVLATYKMEIRKWKLFYHRQLIECS